MNERGTRGTALLLAWALPVGTAAVLQAYQPLWFLLPASALLLRLIRRAAGADEDDGDFDAALGTPPAPHEIPPEARRAARSLAVILPLLGLLILARIVIVPYSLYETWFRLIELGRSGGTVSNVFVWAAAYLGVLAGGSIYRFGLRSSLPAVALAALLLTGIATGSRAVFTAAAAVGVLTISSLSGSFAGNGARSSFTGTGARSMRLRISATLFAVAALVATPAMLLEGGTGNVLIDRVISPGLRNAIIRVFPRFPLHYGTGMHGYTLDSANLAGRPSLSESPVLEVTAPPGETIYLRNETYDTYSWRSWQRSPRLEESKERSARGIISEEAPEEAPEEAGITVRFLADMYERVPHTLSTVHADLPSASADAGITGDIDSGFTFTDPPARGEEITLYEGEREPSALERLGSRRRTGVYLQLPPHLPSSVSELGRELRAEGGDTRETIERISAHLSEGFRYTLEPTEPPRDRDFVEDFLFHSQEGYCVQFATSFVILARVSGIPARYATGFLVSMPASSENEVDGSSAGDRVRQTVTGLRAHAWPEVWIPDEGWTVWEATPPMRGDGLASSTSNDSLTGRRLDEMGRSPDEEEQMLEEVDTAEGTGEDPPDGRDEAEARDAETGYGDVLIRGALFLAAAAMTTVLLVVALRRRGPGEPRAAFDATIERLVRHFEAAGVPRPARTGYRLWAANAARMLPEYSGSIRRAAETTQRMLFASHTPTAAERRMVTLLERAARTGRLRRRR